MQRGKTLRHDQCNRLLVLAARADSLARLFSRKQITKDEYIERIDLLRVEFGLPPIGIEPGVQRDERINRAIDISFERNITVGELAKRVGLSEPRFSHLFAITTGILPGEHLRILREFREEQQMAAEILAEIGIISDESRL